MRFLFQLAVTVSALERDTAINADGWGLLRGVTEKMNHESMRALRDAGFLCLLAAARNARGLIVASTVAEELRDLRAAVVSVGVYELCCELSLGNLCY